MASARIDIAAVLRMISEICETITGTGAGHVPIRQLGEPEPDSNGTYWARVMGLTYHGRDRHRQGSGGADEQDFGTGQVMIGVFITPDQTSPSAVATAAQTVSDAFDEVTKRDSDTAEPTAANKHLIDFKRPLIEFVNEPDPERGIRIADVTVAFTVQRLAGTSRENYVS